MEVFAYDSWPNIRTNDSQVLNVQRGQRVCTEIGNHIGLTKWPTLRWSGILILWRIIMLAVLPASPGEVLYVTSVEYQVPVTEPIMTCVMLMDFELRSEVVLVLPRHNKMRP